MPDVYPGDPWARIRQLEKDVEELRAMLQNRQPLTTASRGWRMANMAVPSVSAGEIHVGSNNDDLFVQTASGTRRIAPVMSSVAALTVPAGSANDSIVAVGGTYDQTVLNDNFRDLGTKVNDVISRLKSTGRMNF